MSKLQDTRLISQANGCSRITVFAENITTGVTAAYSVKNSIPDEGLSYNLDTLKSKKRETQANYNCNGVFAGLTKGNQIYEEKTMDLVFGDDYNFVTAGIDPTVSRSTIKAMYDGTSFLHGSDTVSVLGTQGTRNIVTNTTNLDTKYALLEDGKLLDPNLKTATGGRVTETNNAVTAYSDTNCVMMEFKYAFEGTTYKGDRFVYYLPETCDFNEGTGADYNRYSVSGTRYCDPRSIEYYWVEDANDAEDVSGSPASTTNVSRIGRGSNGVATGNIIYGEVDTTDSVISSVTLTNGTVGDIIVLVGDGTNASDNNELFVFLVTATTTATAINANYNLIQGTEIHTTKEIGSLATATGVVTVDASGATDGFGKVTIKTAGASGSAIPSNWKTNSSGSGNDTWLCDIYDWQYSSQGFIRYIGSEIV